MSIRAGPGPLSTKGGLDMAAVDKRASEQAKKPELYTRHRIAGEASTAMAAALVVVISLFVIAGLMSYGKPEDVKYLIGIFFFAMLVGLFTAITETYCAVMHTITRHETLLQALHGMRIEDLD